MAEAHVLFDHVSKKFRRGESHDSLRDLIPSLVRRALHKPSRTARQEFWALQDVSFHVRPGEALGIVGSNGAGKSTTLKLLTRILKPTSGHAEVRGRVGALIELAAGFHPDLTGRENVYLQGAIMGMKRSAIARKFDEIIEFSGLADFMDTPVKRYSSGMNARLGFADAAHLEPEVLIIDEVLAVGDFAFQERAFARINQVVKSGIPVVVVSHQLERVSTLCTSAILLERGRVVRQGSPREVIAAYVSGTEQTVTIDESSPIQLTSVELPSHHPVTSGNWATVTVRGVLREDVGADMAMGIRVRALHNGQLVFSTGTHRCHIPMPDPGEFALQTRLQMNVPPGIYAFESVVWDRASDREVAKGPSVTLEVKPGVSFGGTVQMNPEMSLTTPELSRIRVAAGERARSPARAFPGT
jgi:ABC-type polysaccharide/polyol phosphate transport system ATPase subunit